MKRITECRVCGDKNIKEFLDLGEQPFANSLLKSPDEKENVYPLSLSWCPECSLVQLNHTAEPSELFSNYVWVTATSKAAKEQARIFYNEAAARNKNIGKSYVLEIASNDGTFLRPFAENNYKVLGVDPARNIVEMAIDSGIPTKCAFFGEAAAKDIVRHHGKAQLVMARNVLAHVSNLHDFVEGMRSCLSDDGLMAIEVHYAKKIYEELHYDSIYHEHLCYFTLKSAENLLNLHGLHVIDIGFSPISGGALILYIKKANTDESQLVKSWRAAESGSKVNELASWQAFAERVSTHKERLLQILKDETKDGKIAGYGASARSSTLANYCGIDGRFLYAIADQSRLKHKLYTPGTHVLIGSPENVISEKTGCILLLAWNFADEIMESLKEKFGYSGRCIIPLPNDPRIVNLGG